MQAAGLDSLTVRHLRHAAGDYLIALGVHAKVVQQRMRHGSIRTTMDVYASVMPEIDDQVSDLLTIQIEAASRGLVAAWTDDAADTS